MKILWDLFEISINCFQGFIMMFFPYKFLGGKTTGGFIKNHGAVFSVALAILISLMNYITIFEHIFIFLYLSLILLFSFLCLNGRCVDKIFASAFSILIVIVISAMMSTLSSSLLGKPLYEIITQHNLQRIISVGVTQLLILYTSVLSLKIFNKNKETTHHISVSEWLLISVTLIFSIVVGLLLVQISLDDISLKSRTYIFLTILALIVINIVIFYFVIDLGKKNAAKIENEKLKIQIAYNEQYIENANTEYSLIQKMRHDSKAMYQVLNDFLSKGEVAKAKDHIKKMTDIADNRIIFVNTDNVFVNSIINAKLTIAKSFDIITTCMTINSFSGIDDMDLCRLLSNMLDNAITATSVVNSDDKRIMVNISEDVGTYTFLVRNTIEESVLKSNPQLLSTKKNKEISGLGTGIIRDIAEKYDGRCDFYEKDNEFCCSVILNINM